MDLVSVTFIQKSDAGKPVLYSYTWDKKSLLESEFGNFTARFRIDRPNHKDAPLDQFAAWWQHACSRTKMWEFIDHICGDITACSKHCGYWEPSNLQVARFICAKNTGSARSIFSKIQNFHKIEKLRNLQHLWWDVTSRITRKKIPVK